MDRHSFMRKKSIGRENSISDKKYLINNQISLKKKNSLQNENEVIKSIEKKEV
jgi:hypothetical protein